MSQKNSQEITNIRKVLNEIENNEYKPCIEKFVRDYPQYKTFLLNPEFNQSVDQIAYCLTKENQRCLVIENNFGNSVETLSNIYQEVYSQNENKEFIDFQTFRFKNRENIKFLHSKIEDLSFPEDYFDLIIFENFNNLYDIINQKQLKLFIQKIYQILKVGGCFCINNKKLDIEKILDGVDFKIKKYWSMQTGSYPTFSGKKNDEIGLNWYLKNSEKFYSVKRNNLKKQIILWGMQKTSKQLVKILKKKLLPTEIFCCFKNKDSTSIIDFIEEESGYQHYVILSRPKKIIGILINNKGEAEKIINFNRYGKNFPSKIFNVNRQFPDMHDPNERLWVEDWFNGKMINPEKFEQVLKSIDWLIKFQSDTKQERIIQNEIENEISEIENKMKKNPSLNKSLYFDWLHEYKDFFKNNILYWTAMHGDFWINNILFDPNRGKIGIIDWERYKKKENQINDFMYFFIRLMTKSKDSSIDLDRLQKFLDNNSNEYQQMSQLKKKLDLHLKCDFRFLLFLRIFMIKRILEKPYGTSVVNQTNQTKQIKILEMLTEKQSLFD
jgi:ubiquinone/menaquinone biosynthesis C-methylase UbiE